MVYLTTLTLTILFNTASLCAAQTLFGLSLGPDSITIAGDPYDGFATIPIRVPGNQIYTSWFQQAIARTERESSPVNLTAPIEYFETVQQAVNDHFNRSVQISVITFPIEMISRAAKVSVADAFLDIKFLAPRDDLLYLFESKSAIQYAYNLNTCHGLGLADDCDSEMDDHIAVLLEYDSAKLAISLISMHDEGCQTRAYLSLPSLGESGRLSSPANDEEIVIDTTHQSHYEEIEFKLLQFLAEHTILERTPADPPRNWKLLRSEIRVVVLAGDASLDSFTHLRNTVENVFNNELAPGWLRDSIDPSTVMAIGAAKRGRYLRDHPEDFTPPLHYIHEEL